MPNSISSHKSHKRNLSDNSDNQNKKNFKGIKNSAISSSSESNKDSNSISSKSDSISSTDSVVTKKSILSIKLYDPIVEDVNNVFDKIISVLRAKLEPKNANDSHEQTTDMDSYATPHKNLKKEYYGGTFGKEASTAKIASKVYIKGFKEENGNFFYGIALERLPQAQQFRKKWTTAQKTADKNLSKNDNKQYYLYPDDAKTHKSHALPNYLHGPETSLNMATASTGVKSSVIIGQGDAQGYIEHEISKILNAHKDKKNFDLRWKSTDYFDAHNRLVKRRIKLFALDAHDKNKNAEKFCEVMLGEFYLSGNLAVLANSDYAKNLKESINNFSEACHKYVEIITSSDKNNNPNKRTATFWQNKNFKSRERNYSPTVRASTLEQFDAMSDGDKALFIFPHTSDTNRIASLNVLKKGKLNRKNDALNPKLITKEPRGSQSLSEKINQVLEDDDNHPKLKEKIQKINHIMSLNTKDKSQNELIFFRQVKNFFKYLVDTKIIEAKDIRQFIPQEVLKGNERIKFYNTPVSEIIMSILRTPDINPINAKQPPQGVPR